MFKKLTGIVLIAVVTSLLAGCQGLGRAEPTKGPAKWEVVLDTKDLGYAPINWEAATGGAVIWGMAVFKEHLYICISSGGGGRVYRSADGKQWQAMGYVGMGSGSVGCNDMIVFHDHLYISMSPIGVSRLLRTSDGENYQAVVAPPEKSLKLTPNNLYIHQDTLYVQANDDKGNVEMWRSKSGDIGSWELAVAFGDQARSPLFFTSFDGKLFASAMDTSGLVGKILSSADGSKWDVIVDDGFQSILKDGSHSGSGLITVHKNKLFASIANYTMNDAKERTFSGFRLFSSRNGVDWELVTGDGFGDPKNLSISNFAAYLGDLYAFTDNSATGSEAWRSSTGEAGSWVQVNQDGFWQDAPLRNGHMSGSAVFNDHLFVAGRDYTNDLLALVWKLSYP
jgi:hypothetical protein